MHTLYSLPCIHNVCSLSAHTHAHFFSPPMHTFLLLMVDFRGGRTGLIRRTVLLLNYFFAHDQIAHALDNVSVPDKTVFDLCT